MRALYHHQSEKQAQRSIDGHQRLTVFAVRAGHHCAQPSVRHFGLEGTVRASLAFYNTHAELDVLADALSRLVERGVRLS